MTRWPRDAWNDVALTCIITYNYYNCNSYYIVNIYIYIVTKLLFVVACICCGGKACCDFIDILRYLKHPVFGMAPLYFVLFIFGRERVPLKLVSRLSRLKGDLIVIWTMKININLTKHLPWNFQHVQMLNFGQRPICPIQNVNPKHFNASRQTCAWFQGDRCAIWDNLRHDGRSSSIGWVCHALRPVPCQKKLDSAVHSFLLFSSRVSSSRDIQKLAGNSFQKAPCLICLVLHVLHVSRKGGLTVCIFCFPCAG